MISASALVLMSDFCFGSQGARHSSGLLRLEVSNLGIGIYKHSRDYSIVYVPNLQAIFIVGYLIFFFFGNYVYSFLLQQKQGGGSN